MKYRQPPRYDVSQAIRVRVGDTDYFAFLDPEVVVQEVAGKGGKTVTRRVTSRRIETAALLRACDIHYSEQS